MTTNVSSPRIPIIGDIFETKDVNGSTCCFKFIEFRPKIQNNNHHRNEDKYVLVKCSRSGKEYRETRSTNLIFLNTLYKYISWCRVGTRVKTENQKAGIWKRRIKSLKSTIEWSTKEIIRLEEKIKQHEEEQHKKASFYYVHKDHIS